MAEPKEASTEPEITIVLAAYQAEAFIARTLDSIQNQTFSNYTCLIADDDSSDGTFNLIQGQVRGDTRFVVHRNPRNLGWTANVNQLLDMVQTPYFMIMPHDDELKPGYLLKTIEELKQHPEAIASYTDMLAHLESRTELSQYKELENEPDPAKRRILHTNRKGHWWIPYRALVVTSMATGIRLKTHSSGEFEADFVWILELLLRGPMVRVPETLYIKHYGAQSLSKSWPTTPLVFCSISLSCFPVIWKSQIAFYEKMQLSFLLLYKMLGRVVHGFLLER